MLQKKHRTIVLGTFIAGIIFLLASVSSFWSAFIEGKESLGVFPLFFAVLAIVSFTFQFRLSFQLTNIDEFENYVEDKVRKGRSDLLNDIKSEENKRKETEKKVDDIPDLAKEILPTGNFKKADAFGKKLLVNIANKLNVVQGMFYLVDDSGETFCFTAGYALTDINNTANFKIGENLNGEAAKNKEIMLVDEIPENYFVVESGLGKSQPGSLSILPIIDNDKTIAVVELASFTAMTDKNIKILEETAKQVASKVKSFVKA
jgi:putative methionine-R-sulfoxide reductase with GAF domain